MENDFGGSGITKLLYDWIVQNLEPGKLVLELGSGDVSTKFLSERYQVTSVEHDHAFIGRYARATYIYAPLVNGWYSRAALETMLPTGYDLLLVDGPVGSESRVKFADHIDLFRHDVPIIIDDTWREPERAMAHKLMNQLMMMIASVSDHFIVLCPTK